jgi:hypothetical protein
MFKTLTVMTALIAFGIAFAAPSVWTAVSAEDPPPSEHPQDWIDRSTGQMDPARVPERIKLSTDLVPSGVGWIDPSAIFPLPDSPQTPGPFDVYGTEDGDSVVAWAYASGEVLPVGSPSPEAPPITTTR